jgi:hypothetical protein
MSEYPPNYVDKPEKPDETDNGENLDVNGEYGYQRAVDGTFEDLYEPFDPLASLYDTE